MQAASVSRFEAKGFLHTAETVKGVHILPFLPNFVGIVGRLEELQDAAAVPQQQPALPSAGEPAPPKSFDNKRAIKLSRPMGISVTRQ